MSTDFAANDGVQSPNPGNTPEEIWVLWSIISSQLSITDDSDSVVLTPLISVPNSPVPNPERALIQVKKAPYALEAENPMPQVIIGPTLASTAKSLSGGLFIRQWIQVSITIMTRDYDGNDLGFTLSGDITRSKIAKAIREIIRQNRNNPGGYGLFNNLHIIDPGRNADLAQGARVMTSAGTVFKNGTPLYRTTIKVELFGIES